MEQAIIIFGIYLVVCMVFSYPAACWFKNIKGGDDVIPLIIAGIVSIPTFIVFMMMFFKPYMIAEGIFTLFISVIIPVMGAWIYAISQPNLKLEAHQAKVLEHNEKVSTLLEAIMSDLSKK